MSNNEWKKVCAACAEGTPPERCAYYGDPNGCNAPTLGKHPEGNLAERLQEALEKAERRIAELERSPVNAAALREALERIRPLVRAAGATQYVPERKALVDGALSIIDAALAAPARNCDVGTAEEQEDRFFNFCKAHECTMNCPIKKKWNFKCGHKPSCGVIWSQMPYEAEQKGETDGSK